MPNKTLILFLILFSFFNRFKAQVLISNEIKLSNELIRILRDYNLVFVHISEKENAIVEKKHNKSIIHFQSKYGIYWRDSILSLIDLNREELFLKLNCYKEINIHNTESKHYRHTEIHFDKFGFVTKKRQQIRFNELKRVFKTWCFDSNGKLERTYKEIIFKNLSDPKK